MKMSGSASDLGVKLIIHFLDTVKSHFCFILEHVGFDVFLISNTIKALYVI